MKGALSMGVCSASNHTSILMSHTYHTSASLQNGLDCTLLPHPTSKALLNPPTPRQRMLVCGACIGTAQVGALLAVPLDSLFKRSDLRSLLDIKSVTWYIYLSLSRRCLSPATLYLCATSRCAFLPILSCVLYFCVFTVYSLRLISSSIIAERISR